MNRGDCRASVVIGGDDVYEDLFGGALALQEIAGSVGFATSRRMGLAHLLTEEADPQTLILYTAMGECTESEQSALEQRVARGMGLVAIHSANVFASDGGAVAAGYRGIYELIGSRYVSHGPTPHESRFLVELDRGHEITRGLEDFEITHEHYAIEFADDDVRILGHRKTAGGAEPLLYLREHARGRICYLQLGHDMRVWDEPVVRRLVGRSIRWASGESECA